MKLEFFSAHDNNLIYILRALGLTNYTDDYQEFLEPTKYFSYRNPPLASLLLFELHEVEGMHFVRVIFNDQVMEIDGCQKYCPYSQFKRLAEKLILNNYDRECQTQKEGKINDVFLGKP